MITGTTGCITILKKNYSIYCTEEEHKLLKQYLQKIRLGIQDDDKEVKVPDWVCGGLGDHSDQLEQIWSILGQIAKMNEDGTWSIKQPVVNKTDWRKNLFN